MSDNDNLNPPKVIGEEFAAPTTEAGKEQARVVQEFTGKHKKGLTIEVKVASPFTVYYEGKAFSLSGVNATGPFDILPRHHKFISLLEPCTLVIRTTDGDEQKIDIASGLIHVKSDLTTVFLDI